MEYSKINSLDRKFGELAQYTDQRIKQLDFQVLNIEGHIQILNDFMDNVDKKLPKNNQPSISDVRSGTVQIDKLQRQLEELNQQYDMRIRENVMEIRDVDKKVNQICNNMEKQHLDNSYYKKEEQTGYEATIIKKLQLQNEDLQQQIKSLDFTVNRQYSQQQYNKRQSPDQIEIEELVRKEVQKQMEIFYKEQQKQQSQQGQGSSNRIERNQSIQDKIDQLQNQIQQNKDEQKQINYEIKQQLKQNAIQSNEQLQNLENQIEMIKQNENVIKENNQYPINPDLQQSTFEVMNVSETKSENGNQDKTDKFHQWLEEKGLQIYQFDDKQEGQAETNADNQLGQQNENQPSKSRFNFKQTKK